MEAILTATADILTRKGYAGLTTNHIADRAGVNIASLYQYFPGKEAIVAELRRRHGTAARTAVRKILAEDAGSDLDSTLRRLVAIGVAQHAEPALHRAFTEALPNLRTSDIAAEDAPTFAAFRQLLERTAVGLPDLDVAMWIVATAAGAIIHRAAVERPDDLSSGILVDELVTLLERYLRRATSPVPAGARRRHGRGARRPSPSRAGP